MHQQAKRTNGFSMIEVLIATAIFMVLAGAVFSVLFNSQLRYQSESGLTSAFQQANIAIDQIVRDIHSTGFPPASSFSGTTATSYAMAFPWSPNYPNTPCTVGLCATPSSTDLVLEADRGDGKIVWIRYSLQGTTLMRGTMQKNGDPLGQTWDGVWTPYLDNVVNQNAINTPPVFSYFDGAGNPTTQLSLIREVNICLVVQSSKPDPQTHQYRTVTLTGQAVAFNANL